MNRRISDLLYAPIGLIAGASQVIPELAEQGRIQVNNARIMGQMATRMGSAKIADQLSDVADLANGLLARAGLVPPPVAETLTLRRTPPESTPESTPVDAPASSGTGGTPAAGRAPASAEPDASEAPSAASLAIVDYDSLAASQVVSRLVALDPDELEAVRRYELANRGRKTILGRIAQLQN